MASRMLGICVLLCGTLWIGPVNGQDQEESHYTLIYRDPQDCFPDPDFPDDYHEFFNISAMECQPCEQNSTEQVTSSDGMACVCTSSARLVQHWPETDIIRTRCQLCDADQVSSLDGWDCVTCSTTGSPDDDEACPTCGQSNAVQADRDVTGGAILDDFDEHTLTCISCINTTEPSPNVHDVQRCIRCSQQLSVQDDDCYCPPERQSGGLCFAAEEDLHQPLSFVISYNGVEIESVYMQEHLEAAHAACVYHEESVPPKDGYANLTACQLLGNLCVTSLYEGDDLVAGIPGEACGLHRDLVEGDVWPNQPAGVNRIDQWALNMPWLFYSDATDSHLTDKAITTRFGPYDIIPFRLAKYTVEGEYEGLVDATSGELQLCKDDINNLDTAYAFGVNYFKKCSLRVRDLYDSQDYATYFYDMYLEYQDDNEKRLYAIPVLLKNYGHNADKNTENWQLFRRFFLVERFAGHDVFSTESRADAIRYASDITIHVTLQDRRGNGHIYPPYIEITYATATAANYRDNTWVESRFEVEYSMPMSGHNTDLAIAMGVMSALAVVYAFFFTMNVNRRDGKIFLDMVTIVKFLFVLCGALSNVFFIVIFGFTLWWFILYKAQSEMFMVPDDGAIYHVEAYIGSAFALKFVQMIYIIGVQVTADIFFVDWERPRHAPPSSALANMATTERIHIVQSGMRAENKSKEESVSIWRTYFVANEWNELQTIRRIRPMVQLLLVVFLLYTIGMEHWAHFDPSTSVSDSDHRGEYTDVFRFPVLVSTYLMVALAIWLIQLIFSRFVEDPLGNFVDLCSLCNVSVFVLTHNQYGHYIHGRSAHGKADVGLEQMHEFFVKEEDDTCSHRGLVPGSDEQTFEVVIPKAFRDEYARVLYYVNTNPPATTMGAGAGTRAIGEDEEKRLEGYQVLNKFVQAYIDHNVRNLEYVIKDKTWLEKLFRTEFVGERPEDIGCFYSGVGMSFSDAICYGQEMDLQLFMLLFFAVMDLATQDYVFAAVLAYILDALTVWIRGALGKRNIANKTMVDKRFLI